MTAPSVSPNLPKSLTKKEEKEEAMADHDYEAGVRDGKIASLESTVKVLAIDLNKIKVAIYMLYGAIALVQFLPHVRKLVE